MLRSATKETVPAEASGVALRRAQGPSEGKGWKASVFSVPLAGEGGLVIPSHPRLFLRVNKWLCFPWSETVLSLQHEICWKNALLTCKMRGIWRDFTVQVSQSSSAACSSPPGYWSAAALNESIKFVIPLNCHFAFSVLFIISFMYFFFKS